MHVATVAISIEINISRGISVAGACGKMCLGVCGVRVSPTLIQTDMCMLR